MEAQIQQLRALLDAERVHAQLVAGGESGLSDITCKRWLAARKMDVAVAAADLSKHAAWRAAWAPQQRVLEEEVLADIAHDKVFLQGNDRRGRGVCILQGRKHTLTTSTAQQRYITYVIDGMIASCDLQRNPEAKIVAVFELQGLSLRNLDAVGLKNIFALLQQHYVEQLDQLFMVNASSLFWGLWRVVSPFIDPVTRAKVVFVDSTDVLARELGAEVLPPHLGGTAQLIPVQDGWQRVLHQRKQQPASTAALAAGAAACAEGPGQCVQDVQQQQQLELSRLGPQMRFSGPGGADAAVLIHAVDA